MCNKNTKRHAIPGRNWEKRPSMATMSWEITKREITKELVPVVLAHRETTTDKDIEVSQNQAGLNGLRGQG